MSKKISATPPPNLSYIAEGLRSLAVLCSSIELDPANARKHGTENLSAIRGSLKTFGQRKPIVVNRRTGTVEAGNGALTVARELGWTHIAAVFVDDDATTAAGFAIADNRSAELAEWDNEALAKLLPLLDRECEELAAMIEAMEAERPPDIAPGLTDPDAVPEVPAVPVTKPGDLWILGEHRLMCGDSTDAGAVALLMGGEKADACICDPPYGMSWSADASRFSGGKFGNHPRGREREDVIGDDKPFDPTPFIAFPVVVLWGMNHFCEKLKAGGVLVWIKKPDERFDTFLSDCELAWSNVGCGVYAFRHDWGGITRESERGEFLHPTQKPVAVVAWTFEKTKAGNLIFDPFLGSGTGIIAAHQLNRRCFSMEISPAYCDVALSRFAAFTGTDPVRESDGASYSELVKERDEQ